MSRSLKQIQQPAELSTQMYQSQSTTYISDVATRFHGVPKVLIKGDIRFQVTELDVALGRVKGRYRIETENMQDPLQVIWRAEGNVLDHESTSTDIEFDMNGARKGDIWTKVVVAQVTEKNEQGSIVQCGVFVQILVKDDTLTIQ